MSAPQGRSLPFPEMGAGRDPQRFRGARTAGGETPQGRAHPPGIDRDAARPEEAPRPRAGDPAQFSRGSGAARRTRDRHGFTLLETMVALSVAALVALLLHRGLNEVATLGRRAAEHRAEAAHASAVRRQMAAWLRGVYVDPAGEARRFDGEDGAREGRSGPDQLRFWTSSAAWERTGALQVTLLVEPGAGLVARVQDRTDPGGDGGTRRIALVPEAEGLELRYYLDLGGERRWVTGWSSTVRLPEAVELRIVGERVPPLLRAPMLVALHGG